MHETLFCHPLRTLSVWKDKIVLHVWAFFTWAGFCAERKLMFCWLQLCCTSFPIGTGWKRTSAHWQSGIRPLQTLCKNQTRPVLWAAVEVVPGQATDTGARRRTTGDSTQEGLLFCGRAFTCTEEPRGTLNKKYTVGYKERVPVWQFVACRFNAFGRNCTLVFVYVCTQHFTCTVGYMLKRTDIISSTCFIYYIIIVIAINC